MFSHNFKALHAFIKPISGRNSYLARVFGPFSAFSRVLRAPTQRAFSQTCANKLPDNLNEIFIANTLRSNKSQPESEYVRCTVYNGDGDIIVHGLTMRKLEFMRKYGIAPRDLRKMIRSHTNHTPGNNGFHMEFVPLIVTRKNCVLLNLLNIRALIKSDSLVIFDYAHSSRFTESYSQGTFLKEMSKRLKVSHPDAASLPYEFRALEAILVDVASNLTIELNVHKTVLGNILASLDDSVERVKLKYLLIQSKKLGQFHQKAVLINDLLHDLLDQDDELNSLYLTEILQGMHRQTYHHQEIELLLESYYATINETIQTVEELSSQIKTSEEIIKFVLDANRNDLMLLGLKFSIGLLSMGITMYVAALYGMNLENFIEETDGGFELVVVFGTVSLAILFFFCAKQLNKLQKITMSNVARDQGFIDSMRKRSS